MKGGTCGILERVANRISDDRGLVGFALLAAVGTGLDVFLGIVPCTAAIVEDECKEDTGDGRYHEEAGEGFVLHGNTDDDRKRDHEDAREDHVLQGTLGCDINDRCIVRLLGACHDAGVLELDADCIDDGLCRLGNGTDGEACKEEDEHGAEECPDKDRVRMRD